MSRRRWVLKFRYSPGARYVHRLPPSKAWSAFAQHHLPKCQCLQRVPPKGSSQFWTYSRERDHWAPPPPLSAPDEAPSLPTAELPGVIKAALLKPPAEPSYTERPATKPGLAVRTLVFGTTSSSVAAASHQTATPGAQQKFTTEHQLWAHTQHSPHFRTSIQRSFNFLFVYRKDGTRSLAGHKVTVLQPLGTIVKLNFCCYRSQLLMILCISIFSSAEDTEHGVMVY